MSDRLQSIGLVDEEPRGAYETAGGFFAGITYPELMGNKCEGFLLDVEKQEYMLPDTVSAIYVYVVG